MQYCQWPSSILGALVWRSYWLAFALVETMSRIGHDALDTAETCTVAQMLPPPVHCLQSFAATCRERPHWSVTYIDLSSGGEGLRHPHKLAPLPLQLARSRTAIYAASR
mmetsp:Transcript_54399/g.145173  ORF Transcript_54399/g.145173 Transcript_54399/m.145173 type:complete len:109 (-) Transcript_54399:240-566(-)